jgi:dCTP deaminase
LFHFSPLVTNLAVLSDVEIEKCMGNGSLVIAPFDQSCLNGAGYDLRIEAEVTIPPGQQRLVATLERVELDENMAATLHIRSSLARAGMIASSALVDPGFRGQLTVSLFNAGASALTLARNDRFLQMVLHSLGIKTRRPYVGRYQDSQGIVHTRR